MHNVILWSVPLFLAVFLRVGTWLHGKFRKDGDGEGGQGVFVGCQLSLSPLLSDSFPIPFNCVVMPDPDPSLDFIAIPMIFYIVVLAARIPLDTLRDEGWIFDVRGGDDGVGWYKFYDYYGKLDSTPVPTTLMKRALTCFLTYRLQSSSFQAHMGHVAYTIRSVSGFRHARRYSSDPLLACSSIFSTRLSMFLPSVSAYGCHLSSCIDEC